MEKSLIAVLTATAVAITAAAQQPVTSGRGSYAAYPPTYKARTDEHAGFNATMMESRKLYIDETPDNNGVRRPIPTNDWWTDLIVSRFSGALWSYPQMLHTSADGVRIDYPKRWSDNGTEVLSDASLTVGAYRFTASEARAVDWHDWDVVMELPDAASDASMRVTMTHGQPFTWFEFNGIEPEIASSAKFTVFGQDTGRTGLRVGDDLFGIYYPDDASARISADGRLHLDGAEWAVTALLPEEADLERFSPYATSVPRATKVDWSYDENRATINTTWSVTAENLRNPGAPAPVMQGFLPHVYKHCLPGATLDFTALDGLDYLTPRGTLKMAASPDGRFAYAYRFSGMLPYYAAPSAEFAAGDNPFRPERLEELIRRYADGGTFGADTYWGGKGLVQMALNMTFAKESGHEDIYDTSRRKLREALVNWLTYTPGEDRYFFSYYPRWGSMVGFDVSYDSDAFNDHHFHFGYFIYAAALLCLEDESFKNSYGEILTMIAKDYANWDRNDSRFPFLRTLDPWAGHSYAGGLGDAGNDNGNGQESSSEAMQSWGGLYLLGVALGDRAMRDAGIFGWCTESLGTAEYWFDRDHIHPERQHNYDYTRYASPYNTNLTSKGIGWWTWFSGDPLWMHSIQWMPVSPCLNYLSADLEFVRWDCEKMFGATAYKWFERVGDADPLAAQSVGNVVLCYMERHDPDAAAAIFDQAWDDNFGMAHGIDTGHISYFVIHSHRTYGDIDFDVWADCPTATTYRRADGSMTYMVYNTSSSERSVRFFRNGAVEATVKAPAGRLTAFSAAPQASSITINSDKGFIIPPGATAGISATVLDQYGASINSHDAITWTLDAKNSASIDAEGNLAIAENAVRGSRFTVTAKSGGLSADVDITVNDAPVISSGTIEGIPDIAEQNEGINLALTTTDQYGDTSDATAKARWNIALNGTETADTPDFTPARAGIYSVTATVGDKIFTAGLRVLPPAPNLALNCKVTPSSEENVGTQASGATDADATGSRWGSQHSDDQWLIVDLGENCRVTRVDILWEAAFARSYDIELAPDGCAMTQANVKYHDGERKASVPSGESWTCVAQVRGISSEGRVATRIEGSGRYLRIRCIERGSAYGYSIIDLRAHGISESVGNDAIVGIDIEAPLTVDEGRTAAISARTFTIDGEGHDADVSWSSDLDAEFGNGTFTPLRHGFHTLTATTKDGFSAQSRILVSEVAKLKALKAECRRTEIITGQSTTVEVNGVDQFGGVCDLNGQISFSIDGPEGGAHFDLESGVFTAGQPGTYTLDFNDGMATLAITVVEITEANLALGQPASASTSRGANLAAMAVDGDSQTRWESDEDDNQWIAVDLGELFLVDRVEILWEGAFASSYRIELSTDCENWSTATTEKQGHAGLIRHTFAATPASAVRVYCEKRGTAYGNSIHELRVFGTGRFGKEDDGIAPLIRSFTAEAGNATAIVSAMATDNDGFVTYTFTAAEENTPEKTIASVSTGAASGENVTATLRGLRHEVRYIISVSATDPFGNSTSGKHTITGIRTIIGENLALDKDAEATGCENPGLDARYAVDGDLSTRWGSRFEDNEVICVDLGEIFAVNNIRIFWNNPAFASEYDVDISTDGKEYRNISARRDFKGGTDDIHFNPQYARWVRVTGLGRATAYGTSIDELEIYGIDDFTSGISVSTADAENIVDVCTIQGFVLKRAVPVSQALSGLPAGLYIVGSEKVLVR